MELHGHTTSIKKAIAVNTAAKAMGLGLAGMTQERWRALSQADRDALQDLSGLSPQLDGYEGCRVEVTSLMTGEKRRFWVGRSSGWRPCHIELKLRTSRSGVSASRDYAWVNLVRTKHESRQWRR